MESDKIQDIKNELKITPDNRKRVNLLNELAWEIQKQSPQEAIKLAEKSKDLAEKLNYSKGLSESYRLLGLANYILSNLKSALGYLFRAKEISENLKDEKFLANVLNLIGLVFMRMVDFESAIQFFQRTVELLEKTNETQHLPSVYLNIVTLYEDENQKLKYLNKAYEVVSKNEDLRSELFSLQVLGDLKRISKKYDEALQTYQKLISLCQKIGNQRDEAFAFHYVGLIYLEKNDLKKALENYRKSFQLHKKIGENYKQIFNLWHIGLAFLKSKKSQRAIEELEKAKNIIEQSESNKEVIAKIHETLAQAYEQLGNVPKAYENFRIFYKLQNEMSEEETRRKEENYQIRMEIEKREMEIKQLKMEVEHKNKELTNFALNLANKNEVLKSVKQNLETVPENLIQETGLNDFVKSINKKLSLSENFQEFEEQFSKLHSNFLKDLSQICPQLTPRQLQVCALVKINLSSKEIANLLCMEKRTIDLYRYRIRKKLELSPEQNLTSFLVSI